MQPAHRHPPAHDRIQPVTVTISGKLGFECWRPLVEARQQAIRRNLPLRVEVRECDAADMAGIGSLLIAIDRLGGIEVVGCNRQSSNWFHSFGICRGCTNPSPGYACPRRLQ